MKPKFVGVEFFAATTDLWTSQAKHPYLSLTVHFVDSLWMLQSITLEIIPHCEDHSRQNVTEETVYSFWDCKKVAVITWSKGTGFSFMEQDIDIESIPAS